MDMLIWGIIGRETPDTKDACIHTNGYAGEPIDEALWDFLSMSKPDRVFEKGWATGRAPRP